jgi:guanosine-3',5'-bis(diphosphate) 3'-pyrophosphohydrolase
MTIQNLIKSLPDSYSAPDKDRIQKAYEFAEKAHSGQKRISGEPYITHCLAVASILAEMHVPPAVIVAGLLHDTVEDTSVSLDDLKSEFGEEVAKLVDGVTKLTNLPMVSRDDQLASGAEGLNPLSGTDIEVEASEINIRSRKRDLATETLRKTFLAMGDDIRVVIIKLADRLHNMRTLGAMPEAKRKRIARETLEIFAPLANRLGIWQMKSELEDLAFRYVDPVKFQEIADKINQEKHDREIEIQSIEDRLQKVLENAGITADISGRRKHIYSIYRKMVEKGRAYENVMDLRGVRLIVADIPTCYSALGIIHTHWRPIPQEFDDYIAAPKDNFYQSLHTAVIYDDGKPLEVQIRTPEMHQNSELGIAAHWRYKEKGAKSDQFDQRVSWLRKMMEWRQEVEDAQEFVDGMKTDVFEDRVFIFTPHGDIIDMPAESTPIDFAYHVHTEIGNRCRGAKVNGKLVTLDYTLKTGDRVEILTAKQGGPSRDWLNPSLGLVRTQRARSKIKAWFKKQDRDINLTQGKQLFEREIHRLGITSLSLDELVNTLEYKTIDDFYEALGNGDLTIGRVVNKISEIQKEKEPLLEIRTTDAKPAITTEVSVLGLKGLLTTFAKCCNPAPGDDIVGYITRGRGATIHRRDCPNILRMNDHERIVKVVWGEAQKTFPINIEIKAYDRQGLMGDISTILSLESINVMDIHLKVTHNLATITLILEIRDIAQLSRVLTRIENLPNVMEAHRIKPG